MLYNIYINKVFCFLLKVSPELTQKRPKLWGIVSYTASQKSVPTVSQPQRAKPLGKGKNRLGSRETSTEVSKDRQQEKERAHKMEGGGRQAGEQNTTTSLSTELASAMTVRYPDVKKRESFLEYPQSSSLSNLINPKLMKNKAKQKQS